MTLFFPIFESLSIRDYDLYPGPDGNGGLAVRFEGDENLVLGVNGLGKSTMLLLLKQMIEGPVRLRSPGFVGERQADWILADANMFAVRANDGGVNATAELVIRIGANRLLIRRKLRDLSLTAYRIAGVDGIFEDGTPGAYQTEIARLMGASSFADVLRICDRVVFFLENRERLLWDWRAQYEVFRSLLLPKAKAGELRLLESQIVTADSSARNIRATMYKLRNKREREARKLEQAENVKTALINIEPKIDAAQQKEVDLVALLDAKRTEVADERARSWSAASAEDAAAARYAHLKFRAIRHALPDASNDFRYILLKIADEGHCLVCDTQSLTEMSIELKARLETGRCIVCGSPKAGADVTTTTQALSEQARVAFDELSAARETAADAATRYELVSQEEAGIVAALRLAREEVDVLQRHRRTLVSKLPKADRAQLARVESEIDDLRSSAEDFERQRDTAEGKVEALLSELRSAVMSIRDRVEEIFLRRGTDFFIEKIQLVYAPREEKIAQLGTRFEFPAFEIDMTSGSTGTAFVRRTYEQASLSQREYLDIAFRMAVMEAFGNGECSIVLDGPEGSVDVVFAERAGKMLSRFAQRGAPSTEAVPERSPTRQIVAACNVVEGGFIPFFFGDHVTRSGRANRTVDLLSIATPTAALDELRDEYTGKVAEVLYRGTSG